MGRKFSALTVADKVKLIKRDYLISPINPEFKTELTAALRSDAYEQTHAQMRSYSNPNAFCVLGVACDLLKERVGGYWGDSLLHGTGSRDRFYVMQDGEVVSAAGYPPTAVTDAAGMTDDTVRALSYLNDNDLTFAEIADFIEENL